MKRIAIGLLTGIFLLTACGQGTPLTPTVIAAATTTLPPLSTFTPSSTPTVSITPLPTIPTFTPTFDVSTILTVTPAPKAECPKIDPKVRVEDYLPEKIEYPSPNTTIKILDYFNQGGDGLALIARLKLVYPYGGDYRGGYSLYDVTGDQNPEFLYIEPYYSGRLLVLSCKNGKYELITRLPQENDFLEYTMQIFNLNMNGISEIVVMGTNGASYPVSTIFFYEWDGKGFSNLGHITILALRQTQITDLDGDGINELILVGGNPSCLSCKNFIPKRQRTVTFGWNGKDFVEVSNEFASPEYRFQAIQDADAMAIIGKYDKAIQLYKYAISNNTMEWWSFERLEYEKALSDSWIPDLTLPPEPIEDKTEYPRLAAYAYYRIMLLHFVQGQESDATVAYNTLQQKFSSDPYGRPYAEMASAFWEAYQSTHKMYDGCAAAIQYAVEHPEILTPLGSDYHGSQSHIYVPADVCPFR